MKKFFFAAIAAVLAVAISVPASAIEHEFSGYWRTRAYTQKNFSGSKDTIGNKDVQAVDTRTRLWYTAKFSDDFKFVNGFEMDAVWGGDDNYFDKDANKSYGRVGTDGVNVQIKHSYVDFNFENFNFKIGAQPGYIGRGFIMDEDFAGAVITGNYGNITVPFYWIKNIEGGIGKDKNDGDLDTIVIAPEFKIDNMRINPYFVWSYMNDGEYDYLNNFTEQKFKDFNVANLGVDVDFALNEDINLWFTGIYQFGKADVRSATFDLDNKKYSSKEIDISAFLIAFGGNMDVEGIDLHGQFFYASGDDKDLDGDYKAFGDLTQGQSYYWAEIMGYGMVDNQWSAGSCGDKISDIMAFNFGASMSPMEKLTVGADIWAAWLAEDVVLADGSKENYLGTELDLSASYKIMDNLDLDLVAAYLFAGDATTEKAKNDKDPYQLAAQLSFSF
ncbi:MAG: hypothetical protein RBR53_09040 [Desulforegulaceae bacterium]|nr:hypothetical protein [Desulforegulaceae bacterium]